MLGYIQSHYSSSSFTLSPTVALTIFARIQVPANAKDPDHGHGGSCLASSSATAVDQAIGPC